MSEEKEITESILGIRGPVYNGDMWTKCDLMVYIQKAIDFHTQAQAYFETSSERRERQRCIKSQMNRKYLSFPQMEKPTGLAALSRKKCAEYEKWLADEPERERERCEFDEKETERIKELEDEYRAIDLIRDKEFAMAQELANDFESHMLQHIIPPDYRGENELRLLLSYLMNNRVHTLSDAINLYHQEKHWRNMEDIAEQQKKEVQLARRKQEALLREQIALQERQMRQQAEHMREMENNAKATRLAVESADFWLMMNYFNN